LRAHKISLKVNGRPYEVEVNPNWSLLDVLRDKLMLTGTKRGCDTGDCGACTVMMDGKPVNSCLVLAVEADGGDVTTVEGLSKDGVLHSLQKAFIEHGALQCGFCTPGMLMSAKALLDSNPSPTENEVRRAIAGNICRCTGYIKPVRAILAASQAGCK